MRLGFTLLVALTGRFGLAAAPIPYTARVWQTDDGLPQNSVFAIAQTHDGYLWVGTHEGLARFDGVRFVLVEDPQAPELRHESISALQVTRDGALWVGIEGRGVLRCKDGKFRRFPEGGGISLAQPRCFAETPDASLWIGTEAGLARLKDGAFSAFTDKQGLGDISIRGLFLDSKGILQVATKRGLSSLTPEGKIATVTFDGGWNRNSLRCVIEDGEGRIWAGSTDGLNCIDHRERRLLGIAQGLPDRVVTSLWRDHSGQLWIGTYSGVVRMTEGQAISRPKTDEILGDLVYTLFEDQEQNIWVGARDGLYLLTPARFRTYTTQQGLGRNNVMSVCEDNSGSVWVGTWGGGLSRLLDGRISTFTSTNGLTHDSVLSLLLGTEGSLWIGMDFDGGLNRFAPGVCENSLPRQTAPLNAPIRVIYEDKSGALWLGTSRGLNILRNGKQHTYSAADGLPGEMVLAISADHAGNVWVGTDGGLARWDGKRFHPFTTREGLSQNFVNALYADADKNLWIGTRGGGLNRLSDGKFVAITTTNGLFSDEIYEIIEDDFGYFWMTCRKGIFRVSKAELSRFQPAAQERVSCTSFGKVDGLLSVQFNGVAKPAGWKGANGLLWFPSIRGVVAVQSRIKTNQKPPNVLIEEVIADQKEVRPGAFSSADARATIIPPGRGELEIRYTALSLQAPEKNRFKYRMEGADSTWVDAGTQRSAHYNNLPPGKYRFQVIASNNDGVWNESGTFATLVLQPHFWQTLWFKIAVVSPVFALLFVAYRIRIRRLREIENLRIQIAANLHDDVGSRLTKVAMVTDYLAHEASAIPLQRHIDTISRTTREITQAMDEIVWTINPRNDTLDHLANYIFQYAQEYFQNTSVRCRLDLPAQLPECAVSTETRHNIFMAIKEALNNVLKHSAASEVRVSLAVEDSQLQFTIADNGRGFVPGEGTGSGDGLENMRRRLQQVGGAFRVRSAPGSGTTILLEARAG